MNKNTILEKIKENAEEIKKKSVKKIGIFGSVIKGEENPHDIDVLVEFEEKSADNFFELLFLLEKLFKKKVDLVIEKNLRPELNYVKKEAEYVRI